MNDSAGDYLSSSCENCVSVCEADDTSCSPTALEREPISQVNTGDGVIRHGKQFFFYFDCMQLKEVIQYFDHGIL